MKVNFFMERLVNRAFPSLASREYTRLAATKGVCACVSGRAISCVGGSFSRGVIELYRPGLSLCCWGLIQALFLLLTFSSPWLCFMESRHKALLKTAPVLLPQSSDSSPLLSSILPALLVMNHTSQASLFYVRQMYWPTLELYLVFPGRKQSCSIIGGTDSCLCLVFR